MFLFPPQTAKTNHVKAAHLQFPLANGGDLWIKDEIVQDTERRILELMEKAEGERRARFSAQSAETASKQPAANACLHKTVLPTGKAKVTSSILCEAMEDSENSQDSVGGDVFEESVVDGTKCELYAFKSEAKRWSQTNNRSSAPRQTAQHVRARRILSEIYICICTCTCCFWYVIGLKSFSMCLFHCVYPKRCKTSSVGQSAGLLILRSSVRFRKNSKTRELKSTWI